ncbi:hypothetical protein ACQPZJ_35610 [Actinoplanes sp. CA-054009]
MYVPIREDVEPEGVPLTTREGRTFDMALSARELSALYALKGWMVYGSAGPEKIPDAFEILGILLNLAESIARNPEAHYNTTGRLMAMKDSDFPGSVDLYLYVGNVEMNLDDLDISADDADDDQGEFVD